MALHFSCGLAASPAERGFAGVTADSPEANSPVDAPPDDLDDEAAPDHAAL